MARPRHSGRVMSASTTWPVVMTAPAPAPAMKRAATNSGKSAAQAHHRLPVVESRPPSASAVRRPSMSDSRPMGMAMRKRARPYMATAMPTADAVTPNACA